jgi:DNA polymerase-3 subunit gamma/tau
MLYRTYRPTAWKDVVGQEHVVRTLTGALAAGRVGHAYLFAGPRGTGKTTMARIFAKAINCTAAKERPCDRCASCVAINEGVAMDLIEIDAASNRGIDDVRALKETAGTASAVATHKVFIVDEVHMLSKDAFNALLKLLEEPPAHVIFVLATTEAHKILPTVLSRVQRFDFKKLTREQICSKLASIAKSERVTLEPEAAQVIAAASDGALRDAEVMLTKLVSHAGTRAVTTELCHEVLGLVPLHWHAQLLSHLANHDQAGALAFLSQVSHQGADIDQLAKGFLEYLRQVMISKIDPTILATAGLAMADGQAQQLDHYAKTLDGKQLVRMIQVFTTARAQIKASPIATLPLELAVISLTSEHGTS